jgi:5-methylcytosine-specific restriction endonuclease McrA
VALVRPCAKPRCVEYAVGGSRWCGAHDLTYGAAERRERERARAARPNRSAAKRVYDDHRWDACRKAVLERDAYRCVRCGAEDDLEVNHVLGITGTDDDFEPELCVTACKHGCHADMDRERRDGILYAPRS